MIKLINPILWDEGTPILIFGAETPMYIDWNDKVGVWYTVNRGYEGIDTINCSNDKWKDGRIFDLIERSGHYKQIAVVNGNDVIVIKNMYECVEVSELLKIEKPTGIFSSFFKWKRYKKWLDARNRLQQIESKY